MEYLIDEVLINCHFYKVYDKKLVYVPVLESAEPVYLIIMHY